MTTEERLATVERELAQLRAELAVGLTTRQVRIVDEDGLIRARLAADYDDVALKLYGYKDNDGNKNEQDEEDEAPRARFGINGDEAALELVDEDGLIHARLAAKEDEAALEFYILRHKPDDGNNDEQDEQDAHEPRRLLARLGIEENPEDADGRKVALELNDGKDEARAALGVVERWPPLLPVEKGVQDRAWLSLYDAWDEQYEPSATLAAGGAESRLCLGEVKLYGTSEQPCPITGRRVMTGGLVVLIVLAVLGVTWLVLMLGPCLQMLR